jgi:paraquat-inducible protein A
MAAITSNPTGALIACHECDALAHERPLPPGSTARCPRCGGLLRRVKKNSLDRTLALVLTGLVLFALANVYPFMTFQLEGREQQSNLVSGAIVLWREGLQELGVLVFMTSIGFPALELFGLLYVLGPLRLGWRPARHVGRVFRTILAIGPWGMLEVYMLGVLVAIVKLSEMATLTPGVAFWSFCALIVTTTAANAALDPPLVWKKIGAAR